MVRIRLLGGFAVQCDGTAVPEDAWRLRKARSLVKLLALAPGHVLHRERACELLWPDRDAKAAANNLHQALHAARRALTAAGADGAAAIALRDDALSLQGDVEVDLETAVAAIAAAREDGGAAAYEAALAGATEALLPEDAYEDWAIAHRDALRELVTAAHLELAALLEPDAAAEVLRRAMALDPLDERATRALMRAHAGAGRRQRALEAFERLRAELRRAYAAEPDEETRRLYRELLVGDGGERSAAAPPPAPDAAGAHPLPLPLTSFVGRERELGELARLLARTRLLTVTGPGGSGKTRLALELAARRDGEARLVELAPLADPALVASHVAAALGLALPVDADPADALARAIGARELLLVLDNCEHLVGAIAALAAALLARCPGLRVLATSREPLHVGGEVAWPAPSLSLPAADGDPLASEAVALFLDRAAAAAPGLAPADGDAEAVATICRRLDGMPLAIELAAARTRHLSAAQLADRLGAALDLLGSGRRPGLDRQQTLRATLDWSYALLDDEERALFARLSVLAGDFGLDAADAVGGDVLDVLSRLVDKSLVLADRHGDEIRYRLLETFRQYGRERLGDAGEPAAAHRRHFLALAERLAPAAERGEDDGWIRTLTAEHPNLRAAIASGLRDAPDEALRLVAALHRFWLDGGHLVEGRRWCEQALAARPRRDGLRARALTVAGSLEFRRGRHRGRIAPYEELLELERERAVPADLGRALLLNAMTAWMTMEWERALALCGEAAGCGVPMVEASARHLAALAHWYRGAPAACRAELDRTGALVSALPDDADPAFLVVLIGLPVVPDLGAPRIVHEETLATFRHCGPRQAEGYLRMLDAQIARFELREERAQSLAAEAVERFRALDDRRGMAHALGLASAVARGRGDAPAARALLAESNALRRATGDTRLIGLGLNLEALLEGVLGDPERARALFAEVEERFARQGDAPGLGGALCTHGAFELAQGAPAVARELLERASAAQEGQRLRRAQAWIDVALADALAARGEHDRALATLERVAGEMAALGEPGGTAACAQAKARLQSALSGR